MKILVCPAHFTIGKGSGSESETAVKIIKILSQFADVTAVVGVQTGPIMLPKNVRLVTVYKGNIFQPSLFNRCRFLIDAAHIARQSVQGLTLQGGGYDVVYHMFPFDQYHPSFFALRYPGKLPIVAGPLTVPHNLLRFPDEALGFPSLFQQSPGFPHVKWESWARGVVTVGVARLALPVTTALFKRSTRQMGIIIAESQAAKNYYSRWVAKDNISVAYNYLELERYPYRALGTSSDTIAVVGNLIARKGIERVLRALTLLKREKSLLQLLVIGDGPCREKLGKQARALSLLPHVRFLGRVSKEQLPAVLSSCAVLVSASYEEAFANTVLEAMALGIPSVAYETASIREIIKSGKDGFVVAQDDEQGFYRQIQLLLDNPSLRFRFGVMGRKKVEQRFSEKVATGAFKSLFQKALPASPKLQRGEPASPMR